MNDQMERKEVQHKHTWREKGKIKSGKIKYTDFFVKTNKLKTTNGVLNI